MLDVRRDFSTRVLEIKNYLDFASEIDAGTIGFVFNPGSSLNAANADSWSKTLRASCFLLIYNLVESTMKNAIEAIFDDLKFHSVPFDDCREGVRRVVLNNFKAFSPDRALQSMAQIALDIVVKTFDKGRVFSGNIDSRKIDEVASQYGFTKPTGKGYHLQSIKNHRNDLAHGDKSFDEIGRDYVVTDIVTMFQDTQSYLESALDNVETYIDGRFYLTSIATIAPSSVVSATT